MKSKIKASDLVESDVESVDNNSLPDRSDNEFRGDNIESDLPDPNPPDHFADHPTPQKLDFYEKFDEDVHPDDVLPPKEALGRSRVGKSCHLICGQYFCSLGEKQVPLSVRCDLTHGRISCKHSKYPKRLKKRQEKADALMIVKVKALMA